MATSTIRTALILELSEDEACWLRAVLQNPVGGVSPDQEDPFNNRHRTAIFNAIPHDTAFS
jgi:hypothetical protein